MSYPKLNWDSAPRRIRGRHDSVQEGEDVQREVPVFVPRPQGGDGAGGRVHREGQEERQIQSRQVLRQETGIRVHCVRVEDRHDTTHCVPSIRPEVGNRGVLRLLQEHHRPRLRECPQRLQGVRH